MNDKMDDVYESKDKQICPYLLIQSDVKFLGTRVTDGIVYFQFVPQNRCLELINAFYTRKAPPCQPKDLLDAFESFKQLVFEAKGGGGNG